MGSTVTLRYEGDDEDDTQQFFVGSIEERQGDLPVVSPELTARPGPHRPQPPAMRSSTRRPGGMLTGPHRRGRPLMASRAP